MFLERIRQGIENMGERRQELDRAAEEKVLDERLAEDSAILAEHLRNESARVAPGYGPYIPPEE